MPIFFPKSFFRIFFAYFYRIFQSFSKIFFEFLCQIVDVDFGAKIQTLLM